MTLEDFITKEWISSSKEDWFNLHDYARCGYCIPDEDSRSDDKRRYSFGSPYAMVTAGINLVNLFMELHAHGKCFYRLTKSEFFINKNSGRLLIFEKSDFGPMGERHEIHMGDIHIDFVEETTEEEIDRSYAAAYRDMYNDYGYSNGLYAPEVVAGGNSDILTDRFSLASLLFYLLFRGNPLDGAKVEHGDICSEDILRDFGQDPLFVFDPQNGANSPVGKSGADMEQLWQFYPEYVRELFTEAFTAGLKDPHRRVVEVRWLEMLKELRNDMGLCPHCGKLTFASNLAQEEPFSYTCNNCGTRIGSLQVKDKRIPLFRGQRISQGYVDHSEEDVLLGAVVVSKTGQIGLRNLSQCTWKVNDPKGNLHEVKPGTLTPIWKKQELDLGNGIMASMDGKHYTGEAPKRKPGIKPVTPMPEAKPEKPVETPESERKITPEVTPEPVVVPDNMEKVSEEILNQKLTEQKEALEAEYAGKLQGELAAQKEALETEYAEKLQGELDAQKIALDAEYAEKLQGELSAQKIALDAEYAEKLQGELDAQRETLDAEYAEKLQGELATQKATLETEYQTKLQKELANQEDLLKAEAQKDHQALLRRKREERKVDALKAMQHMCLLTDDQYEKFMDILLMEMENEDRVFFEKWEKFDTQTGLNAVDDSLYEIFMTDGELPLEDTLEEALPEAEAPEVEVLEMEVPETELPEAEFPEVENPEVEVPETELPEVENPEAELPEVENPEAEMPDFEEELPDFEEATPDFEEEITDSEEDKPERFLSVEEVFGDDWGDDFEGTDDFGDEEIEDIEETDDFGGEEVEDIEDADVADIPSEEDSMDDLWMDMEISVDLEESEEMEEAEEAKEPGIGDAEENPDMDDLLWDDWD